MEDLVSDSRLVTPRTVSVCLGVAITDAQTQIQDYSSTSPEDTVAHVVYGTNKDGGLTFSLCNTPNLNTMKDELNEVYGTQIYGIGPITTEGVTETFEDINDFNNLIASSTKANDDNIIRVCGPMRIDDLKVGEVGKKLVPKLSAPPPPKTSNSKSSSSSKPISNMFGSKTNSTSSAISSSTASSSSSSSAVKKSSAKVQNFFSSAAKKSPTSTSTKATSKTASKATVAKPVEEKENTNATATKKDTIGRVEAKNITNDNDDEDDEWDDGTGYVADKEKLKSRKVVAGAPVGTGGVALHANDLVDSDVEGGGDDNTIDVSKDPESPVGIKIHGAMDDFFEDHKDAIPSNTKKRKKKMVEKTTVDDEGFMVTDYVEEWVTDDEPTPVKKPMLAKTKPLPKPTTKKAPAKTDSKPKQTKGIASFFGAKK